MNPQKNFKWHLEWHPQETLNDTEKKKLNETLTETLKKP
jgi:hypothetical protein